MANTVLAAAFYSPLHAGEPNVKLQRLSLRGVKEDECLVRIMATGLCHTDLAIAANPQQLFPRVLGHEEKIGGAAASARPDLNVGDPVALSVPFCSNCTSCKEGSPTYCYQAMKLSFGTYGEDDFEIVEANGNNDRKYIHGGFFGQSSLASMARVHQSCVICLKGLIQNEEELKLFAPLGCGFQTGAGTVANLGNATSSDRVAIIGLGGVGLSAATKIIGCKQIIAIDRIEDRVQLAASLGATDTINTGKAPGSDKCLADTIKDCTAGEGSSLTIDTTGVLPVIYGALEATAIRGKMILLGMSKQQLNIDITAFKLSGKSLLGSVQGGVIPKQFVVKLIEWYRSGNFPIERLVTYYKPEEVAKAVIDMKKGRSVKPIILW